MERIVCVHEVCVRDVQGAYKGVRGARMSAYRARRAYARLFDTKNIN